MKHDRCKWITTGLMVIMLVNTAELPAVGIQPAGDLVLAGRQAERTCVPLLLEFAADDCSYCALLEKEILNPTLLNRDYDQRVLMRKLVLDRGTRLRDFDGKAVYAADLAGRYRVSVTPTLLFVDRQGRELAERMVGVSTLDFYGDYLDQALDTAREKLREQTGCR